MTRRYRRKVMRGPYRVPIANPFQGYDPEDPPPRPPRKVGWWWRMEAVPEGEESEDDVICEDEGEEFDLELRPGPGKYTDEEIAEAVRRYSEENPPSKEEKP